MNLVTFNKIKKFPIFILHTGFKEIHVRSADEAIRAFLYGKIVTLVVHTAYLQ